MIMDKAIELIKARIQSHKETIESFYMSDTDYVGAKRIKELHQLIKENEAIIKLLTDNL